MASFIEYFCRWVAALQPICFPHRAKFVGVVRCFRRCEVRSEAPQGYVIAFTFDKLREQYVGEIQWGALVSRVAAIFDPLGSCVDIISVRANAAAWKEF